MTTIDREAAVAAVRSVGGGSLEETLHEAEAALRALPAAPTDEVSVEELAEAIYDGWPLGTSTLRDLSVTAARVAIERLGGRGKP